MKIGDKTIEYLAGIITWDLQVTKYKTWPQLIFYFKNFWFEDQYWKDFPARIIYCKERIKSLNNDNKIELLIEDYYNPINFIDNQITYINLLRKINEYLYFDDLILVRKWKNVKLEEKIENDTNNIKISDDLNKKIQLISTRNAKFLDMQVDEQLEMLVNLLEHLLKDNWKYIGIDYEKIFLWFITEDKIKDYRKILQCFRHATKENLDKRSNFSEKQKKFLISLWVLICENIIESKN